MPGLNAMGPYGEGPGTGFGRGGCYGAAAAGIGGEKMPAVCRGFGHGRCMCGKAGLSGMGSGHVAGAMHGRRMGWFAVGYVPASGAQNPAEGLRGGLAARKIFLSAELVRTEALLAGMPIKNQTEADGAESK